MTNNTQSDVAVSGWFPLVFIAALFWFVSRKKKDDTGEDDAGGTIPDKAAISPQNAKAIASKLVDLLVSEYYIDDQDEQQIKNLFMRIPDDENSYSLVYRFFGQQSSYFPLIDGDLDTFMRSRVSDNTRRDCYKPGSSFI